LLKINIENQIKKFYFYKKYISLIKKKYFFNQNYLIFRFFFKKKNIDLSIFLRIKTYLNKFQERKKLIIIFFLLKKI
jgi:hypothetical protein